MTPLKSRPKCIRVCKCGEDYVVIDSKQQEFIPEEFRDKYCGKCGQEFTWRYPRIDRVLVRSDATEKRTAIDYFITVEEFEELLESIK